MKKIVACLLTFILLLPYSTSVAFAASDWDAPLKTIGIESGKSVSPDRYNELLKKLTPLPGLTQQIRESSPKPIPLKDWIQIVKGLGIEPKPNMTEDEWLVILAQGGVTFNHGVSAPAVTTALPAGAVPVSTIVVTTATASSVTAGLVSPVTPPPSSVRSAALPPSTIQISSAVGTTAQYAGSVGPEPSRIQVSAGTVIPSTQPPAAIAVSSMAPSVPLATAGGSLPAPLTIAPTPIPVSASSATLAAVIPAPLRAPLVTASAPPVGQPTAYAPSASAKAASPTLTLELRGMDVHEVLKLISRQGSLNVISNANVKGNVTLYIKDVDIWEALRLVLEANDLAYSYDGNVVRVMSASDYEKLYGVRFDDKTVIETVSLRSVKAAALGKYLESVKSKVGKVLVYEYSNSLVLMDTPDSIAKMKNLIETLDKKLVTQIFALNYAKAEDILAKITPMVTKDIGEVAMDKRTNRIVVTDFADRLQPIVALVQAFDQQHRSVLIEAKVVQITLNDQYQMGVNWEKVFNEFAHHMVHSDIKANFSVLPANSVGITASLGTLATDNYTAMIQALETVGRAELLSSPRITALNNEPANILVGTHEAYVTTTVTNPGAVAPVTTSEQVNFVDVGIKLLVTPTIGEDDFITMKIRPEVSAVARTITTAQGNVIPIVRTSQAETTVLVKNGETILLGGLIEDRNEKNDNQVPFLGRIPLIGILFRGRTKLKAKTELTLFLTPHIQTYSSTEYHTAADSSRGSFK